LGGIRRRIGDYPQGRRVMGKDAQLHFRCLEGPVRRWNWKVKICCGSAGLVHLAGSGDLNLDRGTESHLPTVPGKMEPRRFAGAKSGIGDRCAQATRAKKGGQMGAHKGVPIHYRLNIARPQQPDPGGIRRHKSWRSGPRIILLAAKGVGVMRPPATGKLAPKRPARAPPLAGPGMRPRRGGTFGRRAALRRTPRRSHPR